MSYTSKVFTDDNTWTFDYETYYDDEYSLKKMSVEEYVRDERFLCHGLSIKRGARPSIWIAGHDRVQRLLRTLKFEDKVVIGQNAKFDGFITHDVFGVKGVRWRDTMAMAAGQYGNALQSQALWYLAQQFLPKHLQKDSASLMDVKGQRVLTEAQMQALGVYAARDTDSTYELYKIFYGVLKQFPMEMGLVEMTTAMFTDPMLELDPLVLDALYRSEVAEKQVMLDSCVAESFKQIRSNGQFAALLATLGVEAPKKISEVTNKETWAFAKTDRSFMDMQLHENPLVSQLVRARIRIKSSIEETRAKSYLEVSSRGAWPVDLNVSGARTTHRMSGGPAGGGNPQNLGKKSPLRRAILPPPGYRLVVCDSANIELRIAMRLAGEIDVVARMADPAFDLYRTFASHIYNVAVGDVTDAQRTVGKVACLSLQYGSGADRFRWTAFSWGVELTMEECERIVAMYRAAFGHIEHAWDTWGHVMRMLERGQIEDTWMGDVAWAMPKTIAGCPGVGLVDGPPITYPNLRRYIDPSEGTGRQQYVYDTWTRGKGRPSRKISRLWGSKIFQHICQSLAKTIVIGQVLETHEYLVTEVSPQSRTVMTVHDEGVWLVPETAVSDDMGPRITEIFTKPPDWWLDLPLDCDLDLNAPTYGDART